MRWSVGIEAEGDRVFSREEVVELADAVAASDGMASGIGTSRYGARLIVVADSREDAIAAATEVFVAAARTAGLPAAPIVDDRGRQRGRGSQRAAMIRLGSLAGYPFEGPRLLGGWTPPQAAAVYAVMYKPEPAAKPENYAVIYVGHADDLSAERFPFKHPKAPCWISRAGSKWKVYVCTYEVPGGTSAHREQIARELIAVYRPSCNEQQYDHAWKDEWIGEYSAAPTTAPVTRRGPDQRPKT